VDVAAFAEPNELARLPAYVRPVIARLVGQDVTIPRDGATEEARLVIAAEQMLAGAGAGELAGDGRYARALRAIAEPGPPFRGNAVAEAAARHASAVLPRDGALGATGIDRLRAIVVAYVRDPAVADRLGRDAVASAVDAAAMQAMLGAMFDGLGDPARARAAWQAAVDASPEPGFVRGLATAQARQGDADAALVSATMAAAASGDPGVVWTAVARELEGAGKAVHALEAARSAIDLAGPDTLPGALEVAIAASRTLGRDAQVTALAARRARVVGRDEGREDDPTDARAVLEAYRARQNGRTIHEQSESRAAGAGGEGAGTSITRLWVASRWNRRDVGLRAGLYAAMAPDDPRRAVIAGELIELAGDAEPELGAAAVAALR
jgi:hypothetical protein